VIEIWQTQTDTDRHRPTQTQKVKWGRRVVRTKKKKTGRRSGEGCARHFRGPRGGGEGEGG